MCMSARKGLSTALVIIVTIVVLLVVALVILSLFGASVGTISTLTEFKNQCITEASATCTATNSLPPTWPLPRSVREGSTTVQKVCADEFPNVECINRNIQGF